MLDKTEVAGSGGDPLHFLATSTDKQQVTALRGLPLDSAVEVGWPRRQWSNALSQVKRVALCSLTDLTKLV